MRLLLRALALSTAAVLAPRVAGAAEEVAVRLGPEALATAAEVVAARLPRELSVPDQRHELLSCPGGDVVAIELRGATIALTPGPMTLSPEAGALVAAAHLDVRGAAQVTLTNGVGCLGTIACEISIEARDLRARARLPVAVREGRLTAVAPDLDLGLNKGDLQLRFSGCVLDAVPTQILDLVTDRLFQANRDALLERLSALVPAQIEARLSEHLGVSGVRDDFAYSAALTALSIEAEGVSARASVDVRHVGPRASCLGDLDANIPATAGAPVLGPAGAPAQLAVSFALAERALHAAWRSGLFCVDEAALAGLGVDPKALAARIPGLPRGSALSFSVVATQPPRISREAGALRLAVPALALRIGVQPPEGPGTELLVATDLAAAVALEVDPEGGRVVARLVELAIERLELSGAEGQVSVDPARLAVLVEDVVLPLVQARLGRVAVGPSAFGAEGVYAYAESIALEPDGATVALRPFARPVDDEAAPTFLVQRGPGARVRPGRVTMRVRGLDDRTPAPLLRYTVALDGGPSSAPAFGGELAVDVTSPGAHRIEVRAVDLNDHLSARTEVFDVVLDDVPPSLEVPAPPPAVVHDRELRIVFRAEDDGGRTGLRWAYRLVGARAGEDARALAQPTLRPLANGEGEVTITDLELGQTYQLTLMAYDEAGNVTSRTLGFGVGTTGGCALSGTAASDPGASAPGALILIAVALHLARRARRA